MTHYQTIHTRVKRARGSASQFLCVLGCGRQARDWAQVHGTDGEDVNHYMALCRSCHLSYDGSGHRKPHSQETKELLSRKNRGNRHTPEAIEKIRQASTGRTLPESARRKISEAGRGKVISPDQREMISQKLMGNANGSGKRSGQALENIRRAQRERRRRERGGGDAGVCQLSQDSASQAEDEL